MAGLLRIEIPSALQGGVFTAHARFEGELGALVDDQNGTFTDITGTNAGDVINTIVAHHLEIGDSFVLTALTGGTDLATDTTYYVKTIVSDTQITCSASISGGVPGATKTFSADITAGTLVVTSRLAVARQMLAALAATARRDGVSGYLTDGPILITYPGVGYRAI